MAEREHDAYVDATTHYSGRVEITKYFAGCRCCSWLSESSTDPDDAHCWAREHEAEQARRAGIVRGEVEHNGSWAEYRAHFDSEPSDEQVQALEQLLKAAFERMEAGDRG